MDIICYIYTYHVLYHVLYHMDIMLGLGDGFLGIFWAIVGTHASYFLTGITPEESLPSLPHGSPAMFGQQVDMACRSP